MYVKEQAALHRTKLHPVTGLPLFPKEDQVEGDKVRCFECMEIHIHALPRNIKESLISLLTL